MTPYEIMRLSAAPFLPVLYSRVQHNLRSLVDQTPERPVRILDVGGRKSPYTIGLPATITILDLPRESELQESLNLGISVGSRKTIQKRRSNLEGLILEDMTQCSLPSASFSGVVSVEVIEHVQEDEAFVAQAARVLRRPGWLFLTTPNGDYVLNEPPNYNPDHRRHYTREQLNQLLCRHFKRVNVTYGIKTGKNRSRGLRSLTPSHPLRGLGTAVANLRNRVESRDLEAARRGTAHLFAVAWTD